MTQMTPALSSTLRPALLVAILVVILVAAGIAVWVFDLGAWLRPDRLQRWLTEMGALGPVLLMGLMIVAVVIGPIPTFPITVTAGMVFGPWLGVVYAMTGALIGALVSFWIARVLGRDVMTRLFGDHFTFCRRCSDRMLFGVVLGARLIPVVSFALVSYAAGLTAMSTRAFMLATAIGMLPMTWLYVAVGVTAYPGLGWQVFAGVVLLVVLLGLPKAVEYFWPEWVARLHGGDPPPPRDRVD